MSSFEDSDVSSDGSDFSETLDAPWHSEINEDGELFYIEEDKSDLVDTIQVDSTQPSKSVNETGRKSKFDSLAAGESVQTKTVFISVEPLSTYDAESTSLLKEMLGIIALNSCIDTSVYPRKSVNEESLIVSAMSPGGPAFKSEAFSIGDVLLAINNVAVTHSNIEQVLQRIPFKMELRLTLMCASAQKTYHAGKGYKEYPIPATSGVQNATSILNNDSASDASQAIFFLTMNVDSETAKGEEDIIYMYPKESAKTQKFKSIRGIFTTLTDVAADAFGCEIRSSSMFINDEIVHCGYCRNGSEVLVICQPASLNMLPFQSYMVTCVVRLLKTLFGSLAVAFDEKNWPRLDDLFQRHFATTMRLSNAASYSSVVSLALNGIASFPLNDQDAADIDISMSEFEAADFDDGFQSRESSRRTFSIIGTCLFYKGHLIARHLPNDIVKDMHVFCQLYGIFRVSQAGRILIWREVFPAVKKMSENSFKEVKGRSFYLIIGLRGSLLCILMKSGGCSLLVDEKPCPPPLYINHATSVILHLENLGVMKNLDGCFSNTQLTAGVQVDALCGKVNSDPSGVTEVGTSQSGRGQQALSRTVSRGNAIFHSVHFDVVSGTLITSADPTFLRSSDSLLPKILENFYQIALLFHNRWISHLRKNGGQKVLEEGTMFQCQKDKNGDSLPFWVVGRCLTSPGKKEYFVCYHDSVRQDMTELAFEMGFGIAA